MKDIVTEMLFGEGAFKVLAKIVLIPTNNHDLEHFPDAKITAIGGAIATFKNFPVSKGSLDHMEMWECDLIIVPRKKYASHKKGKKEAHYRYAGYSMSQILSTNYGDPENWGDEYFKKD